MPYLIAASVALFVGLLVVAASDHLATQGRPSKARLAQLGLLDAFARDSVARKARTRRRVQDVLAFLGERVEGPRRTLWSASRTRLIHGGFRDAAALPVFLGLRLAAAALFYAYGIMVSVGMDATGFRALAMALALAATGWILPNFLLSIRIRKRQTSIQRLLPDALDLLVICVEAGLALNQAFQRVAVELRHAGDVLTSEVAQMNLEIRAGTPRDQALTALADRTGVADLRSLVSMLIQTERFGTSIATSLRIHADTMRTKRRQRAEEMAAKTTIKMIFPLVLCIFPALLVVIIGPAIIEIVGMFSELAGG